MTIRGMEKTMERLTKRTDDGKVVYALLEPGTCVDPIDLLKVWGDRLAAYEDTGLEPEEIKALKARALMGVLEMPEMEEYSSSALERADQLIAGYESLGSIDHLRELARADKDGRLVVLPCKVGDVVYETNKRGFISTYKVISIRISDCSVLIGWELIDGIYSNLNGFEVSALGKTVFLTRQEADSALRKGRRKTVKLYDNDEYRETFMELVYSLLHSDGTNDRANLIIDAFDTAPVVEADPVPPNDQLTLEELREMERGSSIWIFYLGHGANALINGIDEKAIDVKTVFQDFKMRWEDYGALWSAHRRKPEEGTP